MKRIKIPEGPYPIRPPEPTQLDRIEAKLDAGSFKQVVHDGGVCVVCPIHAAALDLLKALEAIEACMDGKAEMRNIARAAIRKAKERR